ncbi:zinc finger BED domain-containing protein 4-like isoform X2, partial [Aphis craccivora]
TDSIQIGKRQLSLYESVNKKNCWDINDDKSKEIYKIIGEMICVDNEPFNVVERSGFNKLMAFVKPQYKMPGRKYFTETVIPQMYIELKLKIMNILENISSMSLTSDMWTCITESIKSQKSVQDLLFRARKISTHFLHSSSASDKLKSIQIDLGVQPKKVIQDICTSLPTFKANDWTQMKSLLNLLRPFEELTKRISSNKSIISEVIPTIMSLNSFLNYPSSINFGVGTTKDVMLSRLHKRFEKVIKNEDLILATFLDPRFKLLFFKPEKIPAVKKIILSTISKFNNLGLTVIPENDPTVSTIPSNISSTTNNNNQMVVKSLWDFYSDIATSAPSNNSIIMVSNDFIDLDDYTYFNKDLVAEYERYCLLVYEAKRSTLHPDKAEQILFLEPTNLETENSQQSENLVTTALSPKNSQELLSQSGKPLDTIGLEAALKLLPATSSGTNQEDLELFLEQCEFEIMCANEKAKQRLLQGIIIRLTGKARAAVKFLSIQSWNELITKVLDNV